MKKQGFFVKFLLLVAFDWGGPGPLGHPSGYDKMAPLSSLKNKHLKQIKITFFQNVEDSSQITW